MTTDEYGQLIQFLGQQFAQVDARFARVEGEFRRIDGKVERLNEQVAGLRGEFDQFRVEVRAEFVGVRDLIRLSHAGLDRRVRRLEEGC